MPEVFSRSGRRRESRTTTTTQEGVEKSTQETGEKIDNKLFDKMKRKYSPKIYTIIKGNKNTVNIENDEVNLILLKKN